MGCEGDVRAGFHQRVDLGDLLTSPIQGDRMPFPRVHGLDGVSIHDDRLERLGHTAPARRSSADDFAVSTLGEVGHSLLFEHNPYEARSAAAEETSFVSPRITQMKSSIIAHVA